MTAETHELSEERKHCRWFQYRLRTFVLFVVTVCMSLGAFWYLALHGGYQSQMQLLVYKLGGEAWDSRQFSHFEQLPRTADVLEPAIAKLVAGPPQDRVDLPAASQNTWVEVLRSRLTCRSVRCRGELTGVIEISYRSKDPHAAKAVTHAIGKSYLGLIERSARRDTLDMTIRTLQTLHKKIRGELNEKEQKLEDARKQVRDAGIREGPPPAGAQTQRWNDALTAVRHERLQLEATLAILQATLRAEKDVRQYLPALEATVLNDGQGDPSMLKNAPRQQNSWVDFGSGRSPRL